MTRAPNAQFSGCSVGNGGTLGPADLQVGGPYDGFYRVRIQCDPSTFTQIVPGEVAIGDPVVWTHGERCDWSIEMNARAVSREFDFPSTTVDHGPAGEELIPTWQLMLVPINGENFIWNPSRSIIDVNNGSGEMLRYSGGGDLFPMGSSTIFTGPDNAQSGGGLKHVQDAPSPVYVPGAPFTHYPGAIGGFGEDRFGIMREEFTNDFARVDTSGGLTGVTDGFVGDVFYLPNDPDAPQTYVFGVFRFSKVSIYSPYFTIFNAYPLEYTVNLPGAAGSSETPAAPRREEMTQWTLLHNAATNRNRARLFNTLGVWQGDKLKDLVEVGSSANSSIDGGVAFDAVEGETYMIQVGTGDPGTNGAAVLTWQPTP